MAAHTPGPWVADGATLRKPARRDHEIFAETGTSLPWPIAHTADRDLAVSDAEDEANALLMAAAPELADALEAALPLIQHMIWSRTPHSGDDPQDRNWKADPLWTQIEAALRKAGRL